MVTEFCPNCRRVIKMECVDRDSSCSSVTCGCHHGGPSVVVDPSAPHTHTHTHTPPLGVHTRCSKPDSGPRAAFKLLFWILLVFPLSTMSNPIPPHDQEEAGPSSSSSGHHRSKRPHDRPSQWINPCRIPSALPAFPMDMDIEIISQSDSEIISNIITQVNKAELQARRFMEHYYRETFDEDLRQRDKFSQVHYDFLKEINEKVKKSLGEKLSSEDLEELTLADSLRSVYAGLQMFAVGLEQIVLDQSVYGGNFHKDFQEAEYQLKYVLCELQIAMLEKGIQHEDVTREIMSGDYRDIDCDTVRNIRDWVIFRDYMNTLEYIQQSFSYFMESS